MKKKKKVAIIWVNPFNPNLGVGALAYSAISLISDSLIDEDLEIELCVVGSTKTGNKRLKIGSSEFEFKNYKADDFFAPLTLFKLLLKPISYGVFSLTKFDIVFDVGEGDSFSDIYGDRRFNRINSSKRLFSFLGIKQVLLPQTIGPFRKSKTRTRALKGVKTIEQIFPRDDKSFDYAKEIFQNVKIKKSIDLAFYLPFEKRSYDETHIHVGLNISGLLWQGGYTKDNQFGLNFDYQQTITDIIKYFLKNTSVKIHIVPHVMGDNASVSNETDVTVCKRTCDEYEDLILAPNFNTPIEAKTYISGLDFFIGARMHSCIAAFSSGVPVFPMAYSRKFSGLFNDYLGYSALGDCQNDSKEEFMTRLLDSFENRKALKEEISKCLEEIVKPELAELKNEISIILKSL